MSQVNKERVNGFKNVIETFLNERLEEKLKPLRSKLEKEENSDNRIVLQEKYDSFVAQYSFRQWVEKAASRVSQIKMVTHVLKATNSGAKGTSLFCPPDSLTKLDEVASCHLGDDFAVDVVGNAAQLDVYKFLKLEFEGKSLLGWLNLNDEDLCVAFGDDEQAKACADSFRMISALTKGIASDSKMKQLYWLIGDDPTEDQDFILISPMYSSSLAHHVYQTVSEHKYSDKAKLARAAKKKELHSEDAIHEYPSIGIQKLGGTKPQNISQLNSERGGRNYLLASLPPVWKSQNVYPPYGKGSLFEQFGQRYENKRIVKRLKTFLESDPPANAQTRARRDSYLDQILGEFILYCERIHSLDPGWSADSRCNLSYSEIMLLDPKRYIMDSDFATRFDKEFGSKDWTRNLSRRFANWINYALGDGLIMGDVENAFWADIFYNDVLKSRLTETGNTEEADA